MTRYTSKSELVKEIRTQRRRLDKNLADLSPAQKETPGVVGEWSVKDVMAHLMDWERRFTGWYQAGRRGEVPETPAPGLTWGQLNVLNQQIFEHWRDLPLEEVQAHFESSSAEILALIEGMSEEELFTPAFYAWNGPEVLAGWAAANTCNHYAWAKDQIRAWKKEKP
jgi:uncharacterized protein (TIGR03083 family)